MAFTYKLNFWHAGTFPEHLGHIRILRSWGQGQGHRSKNADIQALLNIHNRGWSTCSWTAILLPYVEACFLAGVFIGPWSGKPTAVSRWVRQGRNPDVHIHRPVIITVITVVVLTISM